jgi:hypothetical protein
MCQSGQHSPYRIPVRREGLRTSKLEHHGFGLNRMGRQWMFVGVDGHSLSFASKVAFRTAAIVMNRRTIFISCVYAGATCNFLFELLDIRTKA